MTDPFREWDVAYLMGSLSPEDRRAYERHLEVCPPCEHAVRQLAGMTGILSRVPKDWALGTLPDVPSPRVRVLVVAVVVLTGVVVLLLLTHCTW
ncbi:zf-HC2 domain-containing protein [Lentzea sp. NPDC051838]|uniref:anti-sigma factor family protein n=1 Tax=Lentzea sp. NPDC051838 TaxID=3154849 RepID=UPI00343B423A